MSYQPLYSDSEQNIVFEKMLERAAPNHVGVFDLDSCLFDTRYRHQQIIREFAHLHQHKQLSNIRLEHIEWGIEESLSRLGLSKTDSKKILPSLYHFWKKRFFDDAYLRFDFPLLGSPSFTQECFDREMTIVYLTGRSHLQRSGTETALRRFDFPYDNQRTHLITKRDPYQKDVLHKSQAIEEICTLGTPKLFLDNEPRNVNRFKELFPAEMIVFVDTVHSPNSPPIKEGIHSIYSFMYTT